MTALYVHWPYCLSKCPYCDFNSHVASHIDHDIFEKAYADEIEYYSSYLKNKNISSIFFGGGTPSLMQPKLVESIINNIAKISNIDTNVEITLEANPTSSEAKKFADFSSAGVNRLSIGVQSLRLHDLKALGREHNVDEALKAIELAKQIFPSSSFDLIYARSNQTLEDWQQELHEAFQIAPTHISLYQLTIEKGTPFYKSHKQGELTLPENDLAADMYIWTNEFLSSNGYNRYEISNYAKPNYECKHNLSYWHYDEYLGIGPGAHSRICIENNIEAVMNFHKPEKWLDEIAVKGAGVQKRDKLTLNELVSEILMMGLRLSNGISEERLNELTSLNFKNIINMQELNRFVDGGFIETDHNLSKIKLSEKGLLMHSYLAPRLINQDL